ncbi:MAG: hypothetical protein L0I76_24015, partial [Pseudonocardia sp.]|nr:hypothetical protein [Pseudonocardia sp.]
MGSSTDGKSPLLDIGELSCAPADEPSLAHSDESVTPAATRASNCRPPGARWPAETRRRTPQMPPKSFRQMAQDGFAPINSALTFGPPTDLAAGWDGTLWAIDGSGAPHLYDPLGDSWQLHGTGIDGATQNDDVGVICFRGAEIFVPRSGPSTQLIGSIWPQLPPGYQLGVRGAASAADKIVLFRGGTYLTVPWPTLGASASGTLPSAAAPHTVGAFAAVPGAAAPPVPIRACRPGATDHAAQTVVADYVAMPLAGITGWPQTTNWQAGVIDGAYTQSPGVVLVIRGGEFVTLTFAAGAAPTASGPTPLSAHAGFGVLPPDWLATGFDGGFYAQGLGYFFKGAQAIVHGSQEGATKQTTAAAPPAPAPAARSGAAHTAARARRRGVPGAAGPTPRPVAVEAPANGLYYIPAMTPLWPPSWNPRFQHAPSGRAGGLWGATVEGYVVSSDGTGWTTLPGDAISVAAGVDGSVVAVPKSDPAQLAQWNGSGWATVAQHSSPLAQVSVGNQGLVWTRDAGNAVQQLSGGQLQPVPLAGAAAHIGANDDGTLWHCTGSDANALRLAPDLNAPSAAVAVAGTVQKVASTGFGAAHCLATQNGATQAYSYQSPYAFRTAGSYTFTLGDQIEQGLGNLYLVAQQGYDDPPAPPPTYQVVALDAHTGQELSRSATAPPKLRYTAPVFDPLHDTLIVGLTPYGTVSEPGQLVGLDARDLSRVRWSIALPDNRPLGPGRPTLQGTQLCVSDNVNTLLMYDTGATPDAAPVHRWTYQHPIAPQDDHRLPPPVIANGTVYAAWWLFATSFGFLQLWLWKLDAATGTALQTQPAAPFRYTNPTANLENWFLMGQSAPLLATLPGTQPGQPRQVLHVNGGQTVWGIDVDAATGQAYDLPGGQAVVTSGFGFADNVLWFGDGGGTLYGLDGHLATVPNTPASLRGNSDGQLLTTPVPYTDSQGNTAIILSEWDQYMALPGLLLF